MFIIKKAVRPANSKHVMDNIISHLLRLSNRPIVKNACKNTHFGWMGWNDHNIACESTLWNSICAKTYPKTHRNSLQLSLTNTMCHHNQSTSKIRFNTTLFKKTLLTSKYSKTYHSPTQHVFKNMLWFAAAFSKTCSASTQHCLHRCHVCFRLSVMFQCRIASPMNSMCSGFVQHSMRPKWFAPTHGS